MRALVFTPTNKPGVDVTYGSLCRQRESWNDVQFEWLVLDDLAGERGDMWEALSSSSPFKIHLMEPIPTEPPYVRNVSRGYINACEWCLEHDFDFLVSLQDYIWVPDNGLLRFRHAMDRYPGSLVSGLTSITEDPPKSDIDDPDGHFTMFASPCYGEPKQIAWHDVRDTEIYPGDGPYFRASPLHWEANWAAVSSDVLRVCSWDESYDEGVAYENMAFAASAWTMGYGVYLDKGNHALSLPHKEYFPPSQRDYDASNRAKFDREWMPILLNHPRLREGVPL